MYSPGILNGYKTKELQAVYNDFLLVTLDTSALQAKLQEMFEGLVKINLHMKHEDFLCIST
jgi:hypothetical protein